MSPSKAKRQKMTINPHDPENADEDIIIEDGAVVFHDFDSTSLDDVLICTDYKTRPVTLSCLRWEDHIQKIGRASCRERV